MHSWASQLLGLALAFLSLTASAQAQDAQAGFSAVKHHHFPKEVDLLSATIQELQKHLSDGTITSVQLTNKYLDNIHANNAQGLNLRAVIETAPYESVIGIAQYYDDLRANGTVVSELHGVPILLKDIIATDKSLGMNTTAGSFALVGAYPPSESPVARKLRAAGAIILGKANLSQFSNAKSTGTTNGWSARGGQTQSPYVEGGFNGDDSEEQKKEGDPCGSSSGSAVGVAAGFAAAAIGSETDGSIICPSSRSALYGLKTTVGLSSRSLVIPISSTQDTLGPMAKSAYDAALLLEHMVGFDAADEATHAAVGHVRDNYTMFAMAPYNTFEGKRIGVPRELYWQAGSEVGQWLETDVDEEILSAGEAVLKRIASLGAHVQDPANIPRATENAGFRTYEIELDMAKMYAGIGEYLVQLPESPVRTLEDIVNWNDAHADIEMPPGECCQELLVRSISTKLVKGDTKYLEIKAENLRVASTIDQVLDQYNLDALIVPSDGYVSTIPARGGYPIVNVPLGYRESGRPYGLSFIGRKWSEPTLISLMAAYEAAFPPRLVPKLLV